MKSQLRFRVLGPLTAVAFVGVVIAVLVSGGEPAGDPLPPVQHQAKTVSQPVAKPKSSELELALRAHAVVVVVLYSPGSAVDGIVTREARAGAGEVGAGFVAIDVSSDSDLKQIGDHYDGREAPLLLFFTRGPKVVNTIAGYADRETVAQAAANAQV